MKNLIILLALAFVAGACTKQSLVIDKVNPFIGTGGHGHTYPGATFPFGFVQLSPDTRLTGWDGCSGYHYSDTRIYGFSHTHLSGTGVSDYADVLLMPRTGPIIWQNGYPDTTGYFSTFSHTNETAKPGYYSVRLDDYRIEAELTATAHCGMHKYTFEHKDNQHILLDLAHRDKVIDSYIEIVSDTEIRGLRRSTAWARDQRIYFTARFSAPIKQIMVTDSFRLLDNAKTYRGKSLRTAIMFDSEDEILVKVGLSAVDVEGATNNLNTEIPHWNFSQIKDETQSEWEKELNKIHIDGGTHDEQVCFYTALYHNMVVPNVFSDADGRYRGHDSIIHQADENKQYTVFSLWDTYRATHPLYTLIDRKRTNEFIHSFLRIYQQNGRLPVWELAGNETDCMIGYHAVPVIADAIAKDIGNFDKELAIEAMVHSAMLDHLGLDAYREMGCIPLDREHESVSKTLEYAYDDWCIANTAKIMKNRALYNQFIERAQFYKNIFDPSTRFFRARENGGWLTPFDPREVNFHHTEANAWQYAFYAPQDVQGLIKLMGGDENFVSKLDSLFTVENTTTGRHQVDITGLIGQYAHGNEPSHHAAYLYNYAGKPWKTQEKVRKIMKSFYTNAPDGLSGNEDCGQMSAWYVLSSMGMYPVNPADGIFVLGSPLFNQATINIEDGNTFTFKTHNNSFKNIYINKILLNGAEYAKSYIDYATIMKGGTLEFYMQSEPNKQFGIKPENRPPSYIETDGFIAKPIIDGGKRSFKGENTIRLSSSDKNAKVHYTLDGTTPNTTSTLYEKPISVNKTTHIQAITIDKYGKQSYVSKGSFFKMPENRTINIESTYNPQYAAGGDEGLIDLLRGPSDFRTGYWQGYQAQDFEATVDLGKVQPIKKLALGCLQDIRSWIWMPTQVEFYISTDGINYQALGTVKNKIPVDNYDVFVTDFERSKINKNARFIKVVARNYGTIPNWHMGHGGEAFIFVDEIVVE